MYSAFCAFGVIFVIAFVPETKGRDLNSIAKLFVKEDKHVVNVNATDKPANEVHSTVSIASSQTISAHDTCKLSIENGIGNGINGNSTNSTRTQYSAMDSESTKL